MSRHYKRHAESDLGTGVVYLEITDGWPSRQVEVYGETWRWGNKEHPLRLADQPFDVLELTDEHAISEIEFARVWREAVTRSPAMRWNVEVASDHFQVMFADSVRGQRVDTSHAWRPGMQVLVIPDAPELVAIGTARYGGKTRIQVEVFSAEPAPATDWKTMGDFILNLPSGQLKLFGPEVADLRRASGIPIPAGRYLGRAFSRGTDDIVDEMDESGPDVYRIVLWSAG